MDFNNDNIYAVCVEELEKDYRVWERGSIVCEGMRKREAIALAKRLIKQQHIASKNPV